MTTNELEKLRRERIVELESKLVEEGLDEAERLDYKRFKNYDSAYYLLRKSRLAELRASKEFNSFTKEEKLEFFSLVSQITGYEKRLKLNPSESIPSELEPPQPESTFQPSTNPSVIPSQTNGSTPDVSIHIIPDSPETPRLRKNIQLEDLTQQVTKLVELSLDEKAVGLKQAMELIRSMNPHEMSEADFAIWSYAITSLYEIMQEMTSSRGIRLAERKRAEIKKAEADRKEARIEKIRASTKEAKTERKKLDKKILNMIDVIMRSNGHNYTTEQLESKTLAELKKICLEVL